MKTAYLVLVGFIAGIGTEAALTAYHARHSIEVDPSQVSDVPAAKIDFSQYGTISGATEAEQMEAVEKAQAKEPTQEQLRKLRERAISVEFKEYLLRKRVAALEARK